MTWTVEDIRKECINFCNKAGVDFGNTPVVINRNTVKRLGACHYARRNGKWNPTKIEISALLLTYGTHEEVIDTIGHECCHFIAIATTHEDHGHDELFYSYCRKLGVNPARTNNVDFYSKHSDKVFKYSVYCPKCGKFLGGYTKMCSVTKNPELYFSKCCRSSLKVVKNWQEVMK